MQIRGKSFNFKPIFGKPPDLSVGDYGSFQVPQVVLLFLRHEAKLEIEDADYSG